MAHGAAPAPAGAALAFLVTRFVASASSLDLDPRFHSVCGAKDEPLLELVEHTVIDVVGWSGVVVTDTQVLGEPIDPGDRLGWAPADPRD